MTAAPRRWAAELLHIWFHELRPADWWVKSAAIDTMLRRRFSPELAALRTRRAAEFLGDPQTARAAILLFDQIPRNLFRDSARAYRTDGLARAIARGVIARGWDRPLGPAERQFVYMPFMHSEAIADQLASLRLFAQLPRRWGYDFARSHHRVVARFGRFPHRNPVLGRKSTAAERRAVRRGAAW
jgi:uncharacterized protein (DUF924 family)